MKPCKRLSREKYWRNFAPRVHMLSATHIAEFKGLQHDDEGRWYTSKSFWRAPWTSLEL